MSMVINLVEDHNIYLCEGGPVYNGGVQPTPITYLTQWKIVGNSEVHTLPYPDGVVLPTGYKRCEYLEFHGTEYIDSGIIPEQGISVNVKCEFGAEDLHYHVLGTRASAWSAESFYIFRHSNAKKFFVSYGGSVCDNLTNSPNIYKNTLYDISLNSQSVSFSNFTQAVSSTITKGNNTILIGKVRGYNDGAILVGKIHGSITFGLNNTTIANFIPCLDDNDVPCLYDTVSQTTLYNQGTGTFGYEIEPQPTEIWSCGEYNPIDGKWHILVQPLGGSIADIALDEPLRKVNDVADSMEFPSDTEGKALVARPFASVDIGSFTWSASQIGTTGYYRMYSSDVQNIIKVAVSSSSVANILASIYNTITANQVYNRNKGIAVMTNGNIVIYDDDYNQSDSATAFKAHVDGVELIYELATPTTELVDAPQIEEAESYSCVISQGANAVEWSNFETE